MKKKQAKKATWGGSRPNSGRKPVEGKRLKIAITAAPEILDRIDQYAEKNEISRSIAIEKLCLKALK